MAGNRPPSKRARLKSPDPVAEFRKLAGNPIDPKDTFEVLVRENGLRFRRQEKLFVLNRSRYYRRSSFLREALDEAESSSSDRNTPKRIIFDNHMPDDFDAYKQYVETGGADLAPDNVDRLFPLLRLYVLADELCDFTTANLIMNDIIRASDEFRHTPSKEEILFVWSMIDSCEHPLRMLFVDYQIHEADDENLLFEDPDDNLFEHLKDVAWGYADLAQRRGKRGKAGRADDIFMVECSSRPYCYYHQHNRDSYHLSCEALGFSREEGVR